MHTLIIALVLSGFTFTATDTRTGEPVEVLAPAYQCQANLAADAANRCAIDIAYAGRYAFGYYDAESDTLTVYPR